MHVLITGKPGIGKTTAIERVIQKIGRDKAGGFVSREIREDGRRVGFEIVTLNGERGILAHVDRQDGPRVGKYKVNVEDIKNIAIASLQDARHEQKLIVIDEIASMELKAPTFKEEVLECMNSGKVLATIQDRKHDFLNRLKERTDTKLLRITRANRDEIPAQIIELLGISQ